MQNATLMSHVDTDLVTREQLALVNTPDATRSFKPVPHIELIPTLEDVLRENRIAIRKEQFAPRRDGAILFGVLQLQYQDTLDGTAALGLRTSNKRTMSIQICGGYPSSSATTWSFAATSLPSIASTPRASN